MAEAYDYDYDPDDGCFYYDDLTVVEQAVVPHELVQKFADWNSCDVLTAKKPHVRNVFKWQGAEWIATGSVSSRITGLDRSGIAACDSGNGDCPANQ